MKKARITHKLRCTTVTLKPTNRISDFMEIVNLRYLQSSVKMCSAITEREQKLHSIFADIKTKQIKQK